MPVSAAKLRIPLFLAWRPNLIAQFLLTSFLSLLPLSLVVMLFLSALNKQLESTQLIVNENYQISKSFNELKQELSSLERATRQNWLLKSDKLDELIASKWRSSIARVDELILLSHSKEQVTQWQQLAEVLSFSQQHLVQEQQQDVTLFEPVRSLISKQTNWLKTQNELRITRNQQQLKALQSSFINWLIALVPLTFLLSVGFLWRISQRLKSLSQVIAGLGRGNWQQEINIYGSAELVELGNKLKWVQSQLHLLEQQKDTFLRHVTHELKTPLASMVEGTDLLQDEIVGELTSEQKSVLELIKQSTLRLRKMIESLLSYNAIRTSIENVREVDFEKLVSKVENHFQQRLIAKQQDINWQLQLNNRPIVLAVELVEMMLTQLISNAIKFSANNKSITVIIKVEQRQLLMSVIDEGHGIAEQELTQIFNPFYQGKQSTSMQEQGSGLGLTIVKETVEQLNGELTVKNNAKSGACFTITLPITNQQGVQ